jgi:hypothetical protein
MIGLAGWDHVLSGRLIPPFAEPRLRIEVA